MIKFILPFLISISLNAQIVINGGTLNGGVIGVTNAVNSGSGGFVFIGSTSKGGTADTVTTDPKDLTGVTVIFVNAACYQGTPTLTSSPSNVWKPLTTPSSGHTFTTVYACTNPTVSASMTFTLAGTGDFPGINAIWFSGYVSGGIKDKEDNGTATGNISTIQAATGITPSINNELIVSSVCFGLDNTPVTAVADSGMITDEVGVNTSGGAGNHINFALAHKIQSTAAAINPIWTIGNGGTSLTSGTSLSSWESQ